MPITSLEDSHIKNICRYLRKTLLENTLGASWLRSNEDHLVAFGAEAQRRNLAPQGDITMDAFNLIIDGWERDFNAKAEKWQARNASRVEPATAYQSRLMAPPKLKPNERLDNGMEERLLDIDL